MGTETELKLKADPAALRKLRRHSLVQTLKTGRPRTVRQLSIYFDTPELTLLKNRVALRVRHIGARRIQTVKSYGPSTWARGEWETEIEGDAPRLDLIDLGDAYALFADPALAKALIPVFQTDVRRTVYHLRDGTAEVELALDEGEIVSGARRSAIAEAEIELLSGEPTILFRFALALQDGLALQLAGLSKAERGYDLYAGTLTKCRKADAVILDGHMTSGAAFQEIARSCMTQMLVNQDCLEASGDAEAVHQMRVGLRRLRSAVSLFGGMLGDVKTETLRQDLRWLQGHLGPARDVDVFIQEILTPLAPTLGTDPAFQALEALFARERDAHYDVARQVLKLPRYARLMLSLGAWIEGGAWLSGSGEAAHLRSTPIERTALAILTRRAAKARKSLRHVETLDPHTRHLGRIAIKKLRYAAEFFASLYPAAKIKGVVLELGRLQDTLGYLNDIAIATDVLRGKGENLGTNDGLWMAGLVAGWHAGRVPGLLKQAARDIKRIRKMDRPWHPAKGDR